MGVAAVSHDSVSCSRDYPLGVAAVRPRRTVFDPEHVHRETTGRFRAVVSTGRALLMPELAIGQPTPSARLLFHWQPPLRPYSNAY